MNLPTCCVQEELRQQSGCVESWDHGDWDDRGWAAVLERDTSKSTVLNCNQWQTGTQGSFKTFRRSDEFPRPLPWGWCRQTRECQRAAWSSIPQEGDGPCKPSAKHHCSSEVKGVGVTFYTLLLYTYDRDIQLKIVATTTVIPLNFFML